MVGSRVDMVGSRVDMVVGGRCLKTKNNELRYAWWVLLEMGNETVESINWI